MIRIAIVDDSREYIDIIKRKIANIMEETDYFQYDISEFTDGSMFVKDNSAYDVLLLDIDMPQMNGFELTERIDERLSVQGTTLIYISSHDNYVFESIKHSPFRFVRKSLLDTDLPEAIKAYIEKLENSNDYFKFTDRENNTEVRIRFNDIVYFESYSHDICLLDAKGEHFAIKRSNNLSLNSLEEMYSSKGFIRSNKSYLVNYRHIYKIIENKIFFTNGGTAFITQRDVKKFKLQYQSLIMKE